MVVVVVVVRGGFHDLAGQMSPKSGPVDRLRGLKGILRVFG